MSTCPKTHKQYILYSKLLDEDTESIQDLFTHLRLHCYVIVRIDSQQIQHDSNPTSNNNGTLQNGSSTNFLNTVQNMFQKSSELFALDEKSKSTLAISNFNASLTKFADIGYKHIPDIKESFMVRIPADENTLFPWPSIQDFQQTTYEFYNTMNSIGKVILKSIAIALKADPQSLHNLLDPSVLPTGLYSSNTIRIFNYFNKPNTDLPAKDHNDLGLLTIIPKSTIPGLEVLSMCQDCTYGWVNPELIQQPTDVVILAGETLSAACGGNLMAGIHRVVHNENHYGQSRVSLPFLMKPYNEAFLTDITKQECTTMQIKEFMAKEMSRRESINNLY